MQEIEIMFLNAIWFFRDCACMIKNRDSIIFLETDFYIIDDADYINSFEYQRKNLVELRRRILEYGYSLTEEKVDHITYDLYNIALKSIDFANIDLFVAIGSGGKIIGESLLKFHQTLNVIWVKFNRSWKNNSVEEFEFDFSNLNIAGKNVIVLDDVVVTGSSIRKVIEQLNKRKCNVMGCLVGITNEEYLKINQQYSLYVARCISNGKKMKDKSDPLWYPAIYSIRHIFNFENGLENFSEIFAHKYFSDDLEVVNTLEKFKRS